MAASYGNGSTAVSGSLSTYNLPIVRLAEKPYPASIYTFLGLATLPRLLRRHNPLRRLPREIVLRIARLAHEPPFYATLGDEGVVVICGGAVFGSRLRISPALQGNRRRTRYRGQ
jgi:hypothetical protein